MPDEPDFYKTLQVSPKAKPYVIEAAYKNLARKYHPDVNPNSDAHPRMSQLNRAMGILGDPRKRAAYDRRRIRSLAQRALAERSPAIIFEMFRQASCSVLVRESLRQLSLAWLIIVGGLLIALVGTAMLVTQFIRDSGDGHRSSEGLEELLDLDAPAGWFRAEGVQPEASPPAHSTLPLPATPTPPASPRPTASMPPQALSAVRDDTRAGGSSADSAAAAATPAVIAFATPALAPPTPALAPPTPTLSPAACSAGTSQLSERGNQVNFMYGAVVSFEAGQPDVLVVDVAGTVLQLAITDATEVRGELDSATVVNGQGRNSKNGSITAHLVEVVCPW